MENSLTIEERTNPEKNSQGFQWLASNLGYAGLNNLLEENGFNSQEELLSYYGFSDWKSFLSEKGLQSRFDSLRGEYCPRCKRGFQTRYHVENSFNTGLKGRREKLGIKYD